MFENMLNKYTELGMFYYIIMKRRSLRRNKVEKLDFP